MKKNRVLVSIILIAAMLGLSACGARLDLTDEEVERVVNYSANILQKHNSQRRGTLADVSDTSLAVLLEEEDMQAAAEARRAARSAKRQQEEAAAAEGEGEDGESVVGANGSPLIDANATEFKSLAEILGLSGFSIDYTGYEIKDSYPESVSENDLMFGINASEGDALLVLKFNIRNLGQETARCSVLDKNPSFRMKINGDRHSFLKTLLMDDLATFDEDMEAGEEKQAVLIAEISTAKAEAIQTLVLTLKKDGSENQMVLQGSGGQIAAPSAQGASGASGADGEEAAQGSGTETEASGNAAEGASGELDQEEFDEVFGDILEEFAEDGGTAE